MHGFLRRGLTILLLWTLLLAAYPATQALALTGGLWSQAREMQVARANFTLIALADGTVFAFGPHGDPDRLGQVIKKLLENAVKYSPDGGEIRLTLGPYNGGARLCVKDDGIGLPAAALDKIFEPFGRAPNARERNLPESSRES